MEYGISQGQEEEKDDVPPPPTTTSLYSLKNWAWRKYDKGRVSRREIKKGGLTDSGHFGGGKSVFCGGGREGGEKKRVAGIYKGRKAENEFMI
jgi:hypothetical protein